MQSRTTHDPQPAATHSEGEFAVAGELSVLRDVFRMLPTGVTVQDEQGRFLLVNDAAAAQLGLVAGQPPVLKQLSDRREVGLELLRTGRAVVAEECVTGRQGKQVFLTAHRPVRIADRNLLLSSSTDISEQKAVEDHLFRSAYYDELTGLPTRRVIEHRTNGLLQREAQGRFALAFLD